MSASIPAAAPLQPQSAIQSPVPTLIIGGYLGAGKTTLVNHLLRHAEGRRIAVMVNDFGDINIDADLIEASDSDVISLAGGCVCCSFGADLIGSLMAIAKRQPTPDVILIELSGVALPAAAQRTARLALGIELVGCVVLADAADIGRLCIDCYVGDTVRRQLADADLLLINKSDLVDAAALAGLPGQLGSIAPAARLVVCQATEVPPELVLGWHSHRLDAADSLLAEVSPQTRPQPLRPMVAAASLFTSFSAQLRPGVDLAALGARLATAEGVLRAKGIAMGNDGQSHLLQVVGPRWQVTTVPVRGFDRMVVIGLLVHAEQLTGLMRDATVFVAGDGA